MRHPLLCISEHDSALLMHPLYAVGERIAGRAWRCNSATGKLPKRFISERMMLLQRPIGWDFPRVPSAMIAGRAWRPRRQTVVTNSHGNPAHAALTAGQNGGRGHASTGPYLSQKDQRPNLQRRQTQKTTSTLADIGARTRWRHRGEYTIGIIASSKSGSFGSCLAGDRALSKHKFVTY